MLHWHPWWLRTTEGSSRTPTDPSVVLPEPALWSPEEWLESQARFWDRCLESNRAWWKMAAEALPRMSFPQPGVIVPPAETPAQETEVPKTGDSGEDAEPTHKTPYAIRRRRPVASGAARAKLERQRKRPF